METETQPVTNPFDPVLYDTILRYAVVPVLLLLLFLLLIISRSMSPKWQQERRNRQIRKAVAARQARQAVSKTENSADSQKRLLSPPVSFFQVNRPKIREKLFPSACPFLSASRNIAGRRLRLFTGIHR